MEPKPTRNRWADKFREPSLADLQAGIIDRAAAATFGQVRGRILDIEGVSEHVRWLGTPWHWTLCYSCDQDPTRALIFLIPNPAKPQLCVPLTTGMIQSLSLRRLKKPVRDGIIFSKVVAGTFWPTWELTSRAIADEVLELAGRKHRYIAGHVDVVAGAT
ncbi:MAG: hypothetical protein AB7G11_01545 [Phycisphaerales bacterium]